MNMWTFIKTWFENATLFKHERELSRVLRVMNVEHDQLVGEQRSILRRREKLQKRIDVTSAKLERVRQALGLK